MKNTIEFFENKKLPERDLINIAELEQDMWARKDGLWEYVKCESCNTIYSKEDIYGKLPKELKKQMVWSIEKLLWKDIICDCWNKAIPIYWKEDYIYEIADRHYNSKNGYITILRNNNGTIWGFMDSYIDDFSEIYRREFKQYYQWIWEKNIKDLVKNKLWKNNIENLICCNALWLEENRVSILNVIKIIKSHIGAVYHMYDKTMPWIYEVKLNTPIHALHSIWGGESIWISNNTDLYSKINNTKKWHMSDIFIHSNVIESLYDEYFQYDCRDFIKANRQLIKSIIWRKVWH